MSPEEELRKEKRERVRSALENAFYCVSILATIGGIWYTHARVSRDAKPAQADPQRVIIEIEQLAAPGPMGWSPAAAADMEPWAKEQDLFRIVAQGTGETVAQDNSKANVRLWKLTALNVAQPPPNGPQLTGDCTSWSGCHAMEDTQGAQLGLLGGGPWKRLFPPFQYGVGRQIWKKSIVGPIPDEGCSVGAIARSAIEVGTLSWEEAKEAGYEYSGQLADEWGRRGPPQKLLAIAAQHKLGSAAQMKSAFDVRDAICNGYGVAVGSDFTAGNYHKADGRIVADNIAPRIGENQRWKHALAIDGYDGTGSQPYYHIQNSWYPTSHPAPIDDSPVCGFWVTESTVTYMVHSMNDAWSFSDFAGFVERPQPVDLFSAPLRDAPASVNPEATQPSKTRMSP